MLPKKLESLPRQLLYLYAGTIVTRLGAFVFPYLTIYFSEQRGFEKITIGLVLSVGSIGLLLGNIVGGWLTDCWSRKNTLISALVLNALGFGCLAFHFEAPWQYSIFLFIGYFGSGMYNPAANTLIADLTDEEIRPFAYTIQYVCVNVGMALGPLLGGFLAEYSYLSIFIGDVITSMICAMLIWIGVTTSPNPPPTLTGTPKKEQTTKPVASHTEFQHALVVTFSLTYFFLICPLMGLEFAVPLLVKETFQSELFFVGIIYTINALGILSLSFLIERFIRKQNEFMSMILAGILWGGGMLIIVNGYAIWALLLGTFVWTIGEIIASITVPTFISRRVDPRYKGRFLSLNDIVRSFAGVICPIGLGYVWTENGPVEVLLIITSLPFAAMLGYVLIWMLFPVRDVNSDMKTQQIDEQKNN